MSMIKPHLEQLTEREELFKDIENIVEEYDLKRGFATKGELISALCDAVHLRWKPHV